MEVVDDVLPLSQLSVVFLIAPSLVDRISGIEIKWVRFGRDRQIIAVRISV
jgi:hypothetical protein